MGSQKLAALENDAKKYKLLPPDGGWGYAVAVASTMVFVSTIIPMAAFGLIFGDFLSSVGDETTGTTLANGIFNTVSSFMGLVSNALLNMYSFRKVAFAGSIIYSLGTVGVIFSTNMIQFIFAFGVIEGIGFGLLMPAAFSAFNSYFDKKMALMMSISQAVMVAGNMSMPILAAFFMNVLGFRGTLIFIAVLSLCNFPSAAVLQPVKWHYKKVPVETAINDSVISIEENFREKTKSLGEDVLKSQIEPLMHYKDQNIRLAASHKSLQQRVLEGNVIPPKLRSSIIGLGDRVASVTTIHDFENNDETSFWKTLVGSMDMSLLKNLQYLNVSLGLALCFTADVAFFPIIPLILSNIGFTSPEIAFMMFVYFGSDLISRILLSVVSGLVKLRSRYLVLGGAALSAIFRFAFVCNDTYLWKTSILAILGFLRCFIQTPLPLVLSEEYPDNFATAFSLYMAVNGVISLICGPLMSAVKSYTNSDVMVCHILTVSYAICVVAWIIEFVFKTRKPSQREIKN